MNLKQLTTIEGDLAKMYQNVQVILEIIFLVCWRPMWEQNQVEAGRAFFFGGDSRVPSSASHQEAVEEHQYCLWSHLILISGRLPVATSLTCQVPRTSFFFSRAYLKISTAERSPCDAKQLWGYHFLQFKHFCMWLDSVGFWCRSPVPVLRGKAGIPSLNNVLTFFLQLHIASIFLQKQKHFTHVWTLFFAHAALRQLQLC